MGLFEQIQNLFRGKTAAQPDFEVAEHTVTLLQESRQRWRFFSRRAQLLDYVRACIDELPPDERAAHEQSRGQNWQDAIRSEYGIDAGFDKTIRDRWHARLVGSRDSQANPQLFIEQIFLQHLNAPLNAALPPLPERPPEAIAESYARKLRSEKRLRARRVPINPKLPVMESSYETTLRELEVVHRRTLVLTVIAFAFDDQMARSEEVRATMSEGGFLSELTPAEDALLCPAPTTEQRLTLRWQFEAAQALLWALGAATLPEPTSCCEPNQMTQIFQRIADQKGLLQLRPMQELLDEWDYSYRYHWACKDAMLHSAAAQSHSVPQSSILLTPESFFNTMLLHGTPLSNGAIPMVLKQRHRAFNWLVGYGGPQDWDNVTTDT